jgi:hypothetical protein
MLLTRKGFTRPTDISLDTWTVLVPPGLVFPINVILANGRQAVIPALALIRGAISIAESSDDLFLIVHPVGLPDCPLPPVLELSRKPGLIAMMCVEWHRARPVVVLGIFGQMSRGRRIIPVSRLMDCVCG